MNSSKRRPHSLFLPFFLTLCLIFGCAKPFAPWGYQFLPKEGAYLAPSEIGAKDPLLGLISKDKLEMLVRYGKPTLVSSRENFELVHSNRKVEEWVYLNLRKYFVFYSDSGELYLEKDLNSLDLLSFQGYVVDGMNAAQVQRVRGEPDRIERTNLNYGAEEKWLYSIDNNYSNAYYFTRGMLFHQEKEDRYGTGESFKI